MTGADGGPSRWRRRARFGAVTGAALAVVAVAVVAALGLGGAGDQPAVRRSAPAATTKVTRQTLTRAVSLAGELSYGATTPVTASVTGTVTWLPSVDATVAQGGVLLRIDDQPVVLMYGPLPMFRALAPGVVGADVRQFKRDLRALGYRDVVVDDTYSAATAATVKRWQSSLKLPQTGTVDRGRVVYTATAVRIAQQLVRVGTSTPVDVLSYTGSTRVVTVTTSQGNSVWARPGVQVQLSSPGGTPTPGAVATVEAPSATQPQSQSQGSGDTDSVVITITVADQKAFTGTAGAPVDVRYVEEEHKDVLTVPVNALLALAEGGYGVEVVTAGRSRIVAVQVGLFADGRVEVSGTGLDEGALVGVPA